MKSLIVVMVIALSIIGVSHVSAEDDPIAVSADQTLQMTSGYPAPSYVNPAAVMVAESGSGTVEPLSPEPTLEPVTSTLNAEPTQNTTSSTEPQATQTTIGTTNTGDTGIVQATNTTDLNTVVSTSYDVETYNNILAKIDEARKIRDAEEAKLPAAERLVTTTSEAEAKAKTEYDIMIAAYDKAVTDMEQKFNQAIAAANMLSLTNPEAGKAAKSKADADRAAAQQVLDDGKVARMIIEDKWLTAKAVAGQARRAVDLIKQIILINSTLIKQLSQILQNMLNGQTF